MAMALTPALSRFVFTQSLTSTRARERALTVGLFESDTRVSLARPYVSGYLQPSGRGPG